MTDLRITVGIVAAVGVAIGLGLVSLLRGNSDEQDPSPVLTPSKEYTASIDEELAACRDDLAVERSARIALAEEMERRIDQLGKQLAQSQSNPANPKRPEPVPERIGDFNRDGTFAKKWFSDDALLELGIFPEEIARLRERFEALELEKHTLQNLGAREGWIANRFYEKDIQEMTQELHEDVGDEDFDRILYATGQNNRIRIEGVLNGSAADNVGMLAGDIVVSYAGRRIFDPGALFTLTIEGEPGGNTKIEVLRNGEIVDLIVPRGPLGARFVSIQVRPGS
jgi:hypothetical protein